MENKALKTNKTAILLVNLGTPDTPSVSDVRRYLFEFLNDPRVIDIPWLSRKLLVNLIIVPFRASKSAKVYQQLWDEKGSPLKYYSESLTSKLQGVLGDKYHVELAMRYQNPSIKQSLKNIQALYPKNIIVLPLFPQYASASTGSVTEEIMRIIQKWQAIPSISFIQQFYDEPGLTELYVQRGKVYNPKEYDHVLFSFHGLPERQLDKLYLKGVCAERDCHLSIHAENQYCYKATCYETARKIAHGLGIEEKQYTVCFQSRLGKGWITPFSDEVIEQLAKEGKKKLLVFSPAFVADCLETTIEIGVEYQELFEKHGGHKVQLVPSLNDGDDWVDFLKRLIVR